MNQAQHTLLGFFGESHLGVSPTFLTGHAAPWGCETTLADRHRAPAPPALWAPSDLWIIRGDPNTSDQARRSQVTPGHVVHQSEITRL